MADRERYVPSLPSGIVEYELPDGWQVFVGKTDAANDYVSIKLARPRDRWFHVRGMPGGHVVLRVARRPRARPRDARARGRAGGVPQQGAHGRRGPRCR
jgi:hypothetical protein